MIFQDPLGSLNPRKTIGHSLKTPLLVHGLASRNEVEDRVVELLEQVGLSPDMLRRWPAQLSGGQQQRTVIARALLLQPELIVADEPISSADVSIQAQLINLLRRLQREYHLSMLFIEAARVLGYGHSRIIFSEIMPNVMATVITMVTLDITLMIRATASLSFLGLGVQAPRADWGSMVADGRRFLSARPHLVLVPSIMLVVVCLCFSILGDEVQKQLDPRRRSL